VQGSATDDAVCCDDDEGSVSVMACAVQVMMAQKNKQNFCCDSLSEFVVQNIELLRAVCSCKNKAVQVTCDDDDDDDDCIDNGVRRYIAQGLVQQAMGQVMALLMQCGVLTADQQQEMHADTDALLDEE
jgi:hypothetical protein